MITNGKCLQCKYGYKINQDGNCEECLENEYSNGKECYSCENGQCKKCSILIPYCSSCLIQNNKIQCNSCEKPYILNEDDGLCYPCLDNQYYSNGLCNDNEEGCLIQIDSTTCIECESNYILKNGICIQQEGINYISDIKKDGIWVFPLPSFLVFYYNFAPRKRLKNLQNLCFLSLLSALAVI